MTASQRLTIPAPDAGDRLPHDRAVWRNGVPTARQIDDGVAVSIDRGGFIEQARAHQVDWSLGPRWRFGWAPERPNHDK